MTEAVLESKIREVGELGYWVLNLSQCLEGNWTANLCKYTPKGQDSWEFAHGSNALEALTLALVKAKTTVGRFSPPLLPTNYGLPKGTKKVDIDAVLSGL